MRILYSSSPVSGAQKLRAFEALRQIHPAAEDLRLRKVYILEIDSPPDAEEERRIRDLLRARRHDDTAAESPPNLSFYVMPRRGAISSWSSKATDIFHICGLRKVSRVECADHYRIACRSAPPPAVIDKMMGSLCDRMTEEAHRHLPPDIFAHIATRKLRVFALDDNTEERLFALNREQGLAMTEAEIKLLADYYQKSDKQPTDAELMMFAQVNSEHCRHKLFNAKWTVDGIPQDRTLFEMIRRTSARAPAGILSAYDDNAAVLQGAADARHFGVNPHNRRYAYSGEELSLSIKVETHNHPTAISPAPGAATGSGGEIRDEAATGRGGRSRMGLIGFCVSDLEIPAHRQAWEKAISRPRHIASPLQIMLDAPLGASRFNNEFGRPAVAGYFRTFEQVQNEAHWGYHKPIMLAGGLGELYKSHINKKTFPAGAALAVFGGPSMLIGLGGGAASSMTGGAGSQELDFASVQRDNAEMQRRCQEVIESCVACGKDNPILSIHDVGAGGLCNALPELVRDAGAGAVFELGKIPSADSGLSPMERWCNESQERYVAAIDARHLDAFLGFCRRERCPAAVVGRATEDQRIVLADADAERHPVDMPMDVLFGYLPPARRDVKRQRRPVCESAIPGEGALDEAVRRVLNLPAVASKSFLITIGDRSVGGLVARDQMVGPWQAPVADVAVSAAGYQTYSGEAMAVGERPPVALIDASASARLAVSEAILNILAADVASLGDIKLSANWMVAADEPGQSLALFDAVKAVAGELCPALGIAIPVGKDSVSMRMGWSEADGDRKVVAPLSLVVSAFSPVGDVRKTLTPQLTVDRDAESNTPNLFFIDLTAAGNHLGGSSLAQVFDAQDSAAPDLKDAESLLGFARLLRALRECDGVLAYHDRSDGGLFVCLAEMAFAGHCGIDCDFSAYGDELLRVLFCEGPGAVVQLSREAIPRLSELAAQYGADVKPLGAVTAERNVVMRFRDRRRSWPTMRLKEWWSQTSLQIRLLRDNPQCAKAEAECDCDADNPGLSSRLSFDPARVMIATGARPKFAILREQGINGQAEMAAAFERAGFEAYDAHTGDLLAGNVNINAFDGFAACGGFSYGDVLGAGVGWASSILLHSMVREQFEEFFMRPDTLALGVCNGCQMMAHLREIIPGSERWPRFEPNLSGRFESRLTGVEITPSPSVFLAGMEGSHIPIAVAHGEGRAVFDSAKDAAMSEQVCMRYIDNHGRSNPCYPYNPNGSAEGITGVCNANGRVTIMMPHPERVFRSVQFSWCPPEWEGDSPWMKMFGNARSWFD